MPQIKELTFDNLEFIAMLAHDMKTPVKAQIRAMSLLNSGYFGSFGLDIQNIILNVIASNKYLQTLLDNVLGDFRINNGKFILHKTKCDIRKTIENVILNIGILAEVKEQNIVVKCLAKNTEKVYDEAEIQRVFINLFSNAFDYGLEKTDITIVIKEDLRGKIKVSFKSIVQKSKENPTKAGTGLGLLICRKILEAHGGKMSKKITADGEFIVEFYLP